MSAAFSVVVPAHDEAGVIERCLRFTRDLPPGEAEVVVVANGCSDDTAELARAVPGVTVLELGAASKAVALDAGDRAATAFPRVFLDADIEVSAPTLRALAAALPDDVARLAAPRVAFDDVGADPLVRSFYRAYTRLPYMTAAMTGTGVYAVSRAGRARFDRFPELTADDLFVQRLFSEQERTVLAQTFTVRIPRSFGALVRVRTRVAAGNRQLAAARPGDDAFAASTAGTGRALADLVRSQPRLFPDAVVYTGVTALARTRARRAGAGTWQRDETSRGADPGGAGPTRQRPGQRPDPGNRVDPDPCPGVHRRITVDGVPFSAVTEAGAVAHVVSESAAGRGGFLLTPNVDILRQLRRPDLRPLADLADLVVADGMPVVWASRLAGTPLPERVTGSSLIWSLTRAAAADGRRVMLLGGAEGVADRAAERLRDGVPGLGPVPTHFPPFGFDRDPVQRAAVDRAVASVAPDVVFVGLGFPRQERLIVELAARFPATWFVGCGGSLAMVAGVVDRAPVLLQRVGLEWTHRLAREPLRLGRRYLLDDVPFAAGMFGRAARARLAAR